MIKPWPRFLSSFVIFCGILITGCTGQAPAEEMPDIGIPKDELNTRIKLLAPEGWNTYKIGEIITLDVNITADEPIVFPSDYGAKIFVLEDREWVEIKNLMKYPERQFTISPSKSNPQNHGSVAVVPNLPANNQKVWVRIVLAGNIYRNGQMTDEQTGAYIDVELKP